MSDRGRIPKGLVPGQGAAPTRPSQEPELIYWGNQYGHGIVLKGDLARRVAIACSITGEAPEEFVMKAIDKKIND
jgi:hypothetical protein